MNKYKYHIFGVVFLLAVLAYNFWPQQPVENPSLIEYPLSSIKPAEINEPFTTWYLGEIAVDIPESMGQVSTTRTRIYLNSREDKTYIDFQERSTDKLPWEITTLDPDVEDISSVIGKPAGLSIFWGPNNSQDGAMTLRLAVRIKHDFGYLEFSYTDETIAPVTDEQLDVLVAKKKSFLFDWLSDFLLTYQWTGQNQFPAANQLATQYGYIVVTDAFLKSNIEVMALLSIKRDLEHLEIHPDSMFTIYLTAASSHDILNDGDERSIGDYSSINLGTSIITITRDYVKCFNSVNYEKVCVSTLTWAGASSKNVDFLSYVMGLYEFMLNSFQANNIGNSGMN